MVSPRRSSRARNSQPSAVGASQPNSSSASSISSNRLDRSAISTQKHSPRDSAVSQSHSSESRDPSSNPQHPHPRRTRSSQEESKVESVLPLKGPEEEDAENDVTRCVCGNEVYPGSPFSKERAKEISASKGRDPVLGLDCVFIQCDTCHVWQHGPCVGVPDDLDADSVEFFCEQCRPDFHKFMRTSSGQRYSHYLPLTERSSSHTSPAPPEEDSKGKVKDARTSRVKVESSAGKRRSTMNSRDAAYDEAEQLRIALEQSKTESAAPMTERKKKRSRDESEDRTEPTKRRRTSDPSPTTHSPQTASQRASLSPAPQKASDTKNVRGVAARSRAAKEAREREVAREQERQEAASRRKARSERRRADEAAEQEEGGASSQAPVPVPQPPQPPPHKATKSKGGRPPARRGRLGRNQYTKDRSSPTTGRRGDDLDGDQSGVDSHRGSPRIPHTANGETVGKSGAKQKTINPSRTSMTDLKRRAGVILDFITRAQVELANDNFATDFRASLPGGSPKQRAVHSKLAEAAQPVVNGAKPSLGKEDLADQGWDGFDALSGVEMMDVLTTRLIRWQAEYGKLEK